ncbi:hypothetical protein [Mesorhizobium sp.]|uniref:hypothetical protein n=1 Tax=Mesorhizobium sp. TaxID=1871066 RepID=UPI001210B667|nr:hypothetical protein [Mesorhizobium sp.]TIO79430.1 MAG: hypothetical protein E5X75_02420 [Mesorhizobium sp.]
MTEQEIAAIMEVISAERLGEYMIRADHKPERALDFYLWNTQICEALYMPIQAAEVALRNRINSKLRELYGDFWWEHPVVAAALNSGAQTKISEAETKILGGANPITNGRVVAGLTLGFWVRMLDNRYKRPLWNSHFRSTFPHLPASVEREELKGSATALQTVRNRLSHHEDMIKRNPSEIYKQIMSLLAMLSPEKEQWVRARCRLDSVLASRP